MSATLEQRVPVTVLTGYLGAGKTTLLNRILTEQHGKKLAVIVNEFGEVGVDQDLVIGADEEIFEMNNGCICCTVRGDLIRILGSLMKRRDGLDGVIIETTGLADPGPVAQTFFVDDEMQRGLALDSIVTVVDAKHIALHLDESDEAKEQIAFADVILLNKTDLVEAEELEALERRIKAMNSAARIHRTRDAAIELDRVLDVGGFDLTRALETDPGFLEPEFPFEWIGVYKLEQGTHSLVFGNGPDPSIDLLLAPVGAADEEALAAIERDVVLAHSEEPQRLAAGDELPADARLRRLALDGETTVTVTVEHPSLVALYTQHHPDEFAARLTDADGAVVEPTLQREVAPDHEHDDTVSSVAITSPGDVDPQRVNAWLRTLLAERGVDIFRTKGILAIEGSPNRFVFQGVHMLIEGGADRPWREGEKRRNSLVFIGRDLDEDELVSGFEACLATA